MVQKIIFKGERFLLIGEKDGAIATQEQYDDFMPSFAHLFADGKIRSHGKVIGDINDLTFLEERQEPWPKGRVGIMKRKHAKDCDKKQKYSNGIASLCLCQARRMNLKGANFNTPLNVARFGTLLDQEAAAANAREAGYSD